MLRTCPSCDGNGVNTKRLNQVKVSAGSVISIADEPSLTCADCQGSGGISRSILETGFVGLYVREQEDRARLVMSINLTEENEETRAITLMLLQKTNRVLHELRRQTAFLHFERIEQLQPELEDFCLLNQQSDEFWVCSCNAGSIHRSTEELDGHCGWCGEYEEDASQAQVADIFIDWRWNFDRNNPFNVWQKDQQGHLSHFFGGFKTKLDAENAITQYYYRMNRIGETLSEGYRHDTEQSRAFINWKQWEIQS